MLSSTLVALLDQLTRECQPVGHRLSKIYTRTGDDGTTGLADGTRIAKDSARVEAMGEVDELNSLIGGLRAHALSAEMDALFTDIQHTLFDIGGELAIPAAHTVTAQQVAALEQALDGLNAELPALKEFILPAGSASAVAAHLVRAVCRRAERRLVTLARCDDVNEQSQRYLNRLSDLMFVTARVLARQSGGEAYWDPKRHRKA